MKIFNCFSDLKAKVGTLEEALKREKKVVKKLKQKVRKDDKNLHSKTILDETPSENNNAVDVKTDMAESMLNADTHSCDYCELVFDLKCELEEHINKKHLEQLEKIDQMFLEYNSESLRLLANVPEREFILTPEEITHLAVDWKIHLEIKEILKTRKP